MPAPYNLTNLTSATKPQELISFANQVTGQVFMTAVVVAVFIILLVKLLNYRVDVSLALSGFVAFVFGALFAFAGWVSILIPLFFLVLTAFAAFYSYVISK